MYVLRLSSTFLAELPQYTKLNNNFVKLTKSLVVTGGGEQCCSPGLLVT